MCLLGLFLLILIRWAVLGYEQDTRGSISDECPTILRSQATGTIRCWSGSQLVYQNSIYHNGGVLCAVDGKAIKITGGKSLCVIESSQDSVWNPPTN